MRRACPELNHALHRPTPTSVARAARLPRLVLRRSAAPPEALDPLCTFVRERTRAAFNSFGRAAENGFLCTRDLLDANRTSFEFRGPRLRIELVDRQKVRRHLIREVQRHEHEAWLERRIDARRHLKRSASRRHLHHFAVADSESLGVLRRDVDALATMQGREISAALNT